jgi:hypothetical protein
VCVRTKAPDDEERLFQPLSSSQTPTLKGKCQVSFSEIQIHSSQKPLSEQLVRIQYEARE